MTASAVIAGAVLATGLVGAPAPVQAQPEWELYDNFNQGSKLNRKKWGNSGSLGGGKADVFKKQLRVRLLGNSNVNGQRHWAYIRKKPHTITGVRFKVQMVGCTGNIRGRFGVYSGKPPGSTHRVWSELAVRPAESRVTGTTMRLKRDDSFLFNYLWAQMPSHISAKRIGKPFKMEVTWDRRTITYVVNRGERSEQTTTFTYPHRIKPVKENESWTAFGVRSGADQAGPCTALFDDIEIRRR